MINTLTTLLLFQTIGEVMVYTWDLPVPGPVIGMVLLFLYLMVRRNAAQKLAPASSQLLGQMSVLFVPAGVGIMVHARQVADEWFPIMVALILSTVVSIVVTALVIQRLKK